jgi:hypothetical protein
VTTQAKRGKTAIRYTLLKRFHNGFTGMDPSEGGTRKPPRGIYLLPNLFTTGAMFAGFFAIVASIGGRYVAAAIAVFVAGILDGLDGRVARLTNTQSEFGVQYDSLSDMVSFGLAPSLVMYTWSLSTLREYGGAWGKLGSRGSTPRSASPTSVISRGSRARPRRDSACRSSGWSRTMASTATTCSM